MGNIEEEEAQGNALGIVERDIQALKGRYNLRIFSEMTEVRDKA